MAVVWTDIRDMPGGVFSGYTQTQIERVIVQAGRRINSGYWGDLEDDGITYLAAHLLVMQDPSNKAAGGAVRRHKMGPFEKEFQTTSYGPEWYNSTSYGREYHTLLMLNRHKAGPRAV